MADDVAVGVLVEQQHRLGHERVEPAARLVEALGDEVGGEALLEQFLVAVRVAVLRERHRAGVVPDVDHVGDALRLLPHSGHANVTSSTYGRCRSSPLRSRAGEFGQLRDRADRRVVVVRAAPDRQRRAPEAEAGQRPVDVVLEPVAVAPVLMCSGTQLTSSLTRAGGRLLLRGADVPRRERVAEQRRLAPPAVRVRVDVRLGADEHAASAQPLDDVVVGVLDEGARVLGDGSRRSSRSRRPGCRSGCRRRGRRRGRPHRTRRPCGRCPSPRRR